MTSATAASENSASLITALYFRTKTLHVEAERSGIIRDMLRGQASREGYTLFLRNLLPAYEALETGFKQHRSSIELSELASFDLARAPAIRSDLNALCGSGWHDRIPLLDAGKKYGVKVHEAAEGDGTKLIAHAYTRYLGDLSGGLILQKLLARTPGLQPSELSFYHFPTFADLAKLKNEYRDALDRAASKAVNPDQIVEESADAFRMNIELSWAVQNAKPPELAAASPSI